MSITAKVIADSISLEGKRLTTMQLRYPRFIHSEFMTHRMFSRNASSSRAIPVKKLIEDLRRDPAMPVFWGSNKPGMQAGDELKETDINHCVANWLKGMEAGIRTAELLMALGLHKQIANRVLEPWAHINVVVTATEWDNFYTLRRHKDAQPEMHELADKMFDAMVVSCPMLLKPGDWHLPYADREQDWEDAEKWVDGGDQGPTDQHIKDILISASVARSARVSYLTYEGKPPVLADDISLWERLVGGVPLHASPAEHQGTPDEIVGQIGEGAWANEDEHGNFVGWRQYRKQLEKQHHMWGRDNAENDCS